jgi:DNA-binding MarR family transcriptional regulator
MMGDITLGRMQTPALGDREVEGVMRLIHKIESEHRTRTTAHLDLRARLLIQELGLRGPATIADVRRRLNLTPSTLTSLADRVERDGYVERRRHPSDRRTVLLALTESGEKAYLGEKSFYRRLVVDMISTLDAESQHHVVAAMRSFGSPRSAS